MRTREEFIKELSALINKYSVETGSNTPDFILAEYLSSCLDTFREAVQCRENWYGRTMVPVISYLPSGCPNKEGN